MCIRDRDAFIKSRLEAHVGNLNSQLDKMDMPQCTDEERWYSNEVHAVMKKGGKRSLHNAATHDDAQAWIDGNNTRVKKDQLVIEHRPGIYRKCENYCFASSVCDQYNNT